MCVTCDLAERVIDTIEAAFKREDILKAILEAFPEGGIIIDGKRSEKLDLCAFIAYVASKWAIRYNVHPSDYMSMMINLGAVVYAESTEKKTNAIMEGIGKEVDEIHGQS